MDNEDQPTIKIKIIRHQGKAALIEWVGDNGRTFRGSVPMVDILEDGSISMETLHQATLYGLDFLELDTVAALELENELHKVGIWTAEDVLTQRAALLQALESTKMAHFKAVIEFAKQFQTGGRNG